MLSITMLPNYAIASDLSYTKTKYPIVLAPGLFGFDEIGPLNYWSIIPSNLRESGAEVYLTNTSAGHGYEVRGEQLLSRIEEIIRDTGHEKVNLIGHSQGSQSIRYVAATAPELIASVTSVGGANDGNQFADLALRLLEIPGVRGIIKYGGSILTFFIDLFAGEVYKQDISKAIFDLSTEGANDFNRKFPQGIPSEYCENDGNHIEIITGRDGQQHKVRYYSWSGGSYYKSFRDPSSLLLYRTGKLIKEKTGEESDGMVKVCASHLGKVIKDNYKVDHLDEVNQIAGIVKGDNPVMIWRTHVNRLKNDGL